MNDDQYSQESTKMSFQDKDYLAARSEYFDMLDRLNAILTSKHIAPIPAANPLTTKDCKSAYLNVPVQFNERIAAAAGQHDDPQKEENFELKSEQVQLEPVSQVMKVQQGDVPPQEISSPTKPVPLKETAQLEGDVAEDQVGDPSIQTPSFRQDSSD